MTMTYLITKTNGEFSDLILLDCTSALVLMMAIVFMEKNFPIGFQEFFTYLILFISPFSFLSFIWLFS